MTPLPTTNELVGRFKALGWSQAGLARRSKKDPSFVSRLLTGKLRSPGVFFTLVRTVEIGERRAAARAQRSNGGRRRRPGERV